jgi:hypothetical protein
MDEVVNSIDLVQNGLHWMAFVNMVIKFVFSLKVWNFLNS